MKKSGSVYIPTVVKKLEEFYGDLLIPKVDQNLPDYLFALARKMYEGLLSGHNFLFEEIRNYHSDFLGRSVDFLKQIEWNLADCKETIACEFGFANWQEIEAKKNVIIDLRFEETIHYLLAGNIQYLNQNLIENPGLAKQRSGFGHNATLLHYCASNGVEMWRQKAPLNLVEIVQLLLKYGSDPQATMKVYGGEFTALQLAATSAHPFEVGIAEKLLKILNPKI